MVVPGRVVIFFVQGAAKANLVGVVPSEVRKTSREVGFYGRQREGRAGASPARYVVGNSGDVNI
jgi:hypothetical protein